MSMNCYSYEEGNIYINKQEKYLKEKYNRKECKKKIESYETNYKGQILLSGIVNEVVQEDRTGKGRILLNRVCVNKETFKDHIWLNINTKTDKISKGDKIFAFAKMKIYKKENEHRIEFVSLRSIDINSVRFKDYYTKEKK